MGLLFADLLLVLHFAIVLFITGGLILVWIGAWRRWAWVRNPVFRYMHLAAIAFVALEALLGYACPLTVWEDALRGGTRSASFVGRIVRAVLYYDAPAWVFTVLYAAWAAASAATLYFVPATQRPRPRPAP
jgi:hypothetical protein